MFYIYGFLIFIFTGFAHAALPLVGSYVLTASPYTKATTPDGACRGYSHPAGKTFAGVELVSSYGSPEYMCLWKDTSGTVTGAASAVYSTSPENLTCPANSTKSGSSCTCDSGYVEQGSQCVQNDPCDGLADMCSGSQGKSGAFSISGKNIGVSFTCMSPLSFGANPLPGCSKGCMGEVGGYPTAIKSDSGTWTTQGIAKFSGATCDPSVINDLNKQADPDFEPQPNPEPSKSPECTNGYQGTVNGVSVCVPPKASTGIVGTETKDNGDGTKTDTKTDVKCENGKCEVTKTSTTTNTTTNTTVGTSSSTATVDKAAYCNENKTAGVCKDENGDNPDGTGSFTGNCDAGFQCKGDAVQCAIAKEQHRRMCQIFDDKSPETALFNQSKGKDGIQRGDEGSPIDLAGRISTDSLIGAGSCMRDFQIQFMDRPVNVKLSNLCPYLEMLGNILVAVGMVMAIRIVGIR